VVLLDLQVQRELLVQLERQVLQTVVLHLELQDLAVQQVLLVLLVPQEQVNYLLLVVLQVQVVHQDL
jgi:hypothetical protein